MRNQSERKFEFSSVKDMLSVIVLSFNSGLYLFEAIDSILKQDYPSIELIITDDGSMDFNEVLVKEYIEKNKFCNISFKIIHHDENIGTVKNINHALSITHGEFIKILGGDDAYPSPYTFSEQIMNIKNNNSLATIGKLQQCNHNMVPIFDERVEQSNTDLEKVLKMDYIEARRYIAKRDIFPIANQAVCYCRNFFLQNGFCDEDFILIEDISLSFLLLRESSRISYMNTYTVNHRAKVGISTSKEFFAPRRLQYYKDCITFAKKELDSHPEIYSYIYRKESIRISSFVYSVTKAKSEGKGNFRLLGIGLLYLDTIVYYILTNPNKFYKRIRERIYS